MEKQRADLQRQMEEKMRLARESVNILSFDCQN